MRSSFNKLFLVCDNFVPVFSGSVDQLESLRSLERVLLGAFPRAVTRVKITDLTVDAVLVDKARLVGARDSSRWGCIKWSRIARLDSALGDGLAGDHVVKVSSSGIA